MKWVMKSIVAAAAASAAAAVACNYQFPGNADALQVVSPSFHVSDETRMVTTLGSIRNLAEVPMGDIVVEARFLNASGKLVDSVTQPLHGIVVPAGREVAFRTSDLATRDKAAYASQEVRVASAGSLGTTVGTWRRLWNEARGWLLLVAMFAVLVFLEHRRGKGQAIGVTLLEQQNVLLARLIESRENRDGKQDGS